MKESLDWHLSVQDVGRHVALDEVVGAPLDCIQEVVGLGSIS
jgi:formate dehydrogenase assembly factor FdhD